MARQRTREIGLHMALGATRGSVLGMMLGHRSRHVAAFIAAIAFVACYRPAQRATRMDPMVTLRES